MRRNIPQRIINRIRHETTAWRKRLDRRIHFAAIVEEYGTHLPILDAILGPHPPGVALEFGMGLNSTSRLLRHSRLLFSVEHNPAWYDRTLKSLRKEHFPGVHAPILWPTESVEDFLDQTHGLQFDVALVDGPGASRVACARALMGRARFIVLHDTEAVCYAWDSLLSKPIPGHSFFTFRRVLPWTTVLCRDEGPLDELIRRLGGDPGEKNCYYAPVR